MARKNNWRHSWGALTAWFHRRDTRQSDNVHLYQTERCGVREQLAPQLPTVRSCWQRKPTITSTHNNGRSAYDIRSGEQSHNSNCPTFFNNRGAKPPPLHQRHLHMSDQQQSEPAKRKQAITKVDDDSVCPSCHLSKHVANVPVRALGCVPLRTDRSCDQMCCPKTVRGDLKAGETYWWCRCGNVCCEAQTPLYLTRRRPRRAQRNRFAIAHHVSAVSNHWSLL